MHTLDPRLNAFRDDLAASILRGKVDAARFTDGVVQQVADAIAPLRRRPRNDAALDTEVLYGEHVTVYEEVEGWAWVQAECDGYVGYMPASALRPQLTDATHTVAAVETFAFPSPDIKTPPVATLPLNANVYVVDTVDRFSQLNDWTFVVSDHLRLRDEPTPEDVVTAALQFIGTPYLWGGRTRRGIDCSGLVQTSMQACGRHVLRDTYMQRDSIGESISVGTSIDDLTHRQRGDLVYWPGHVGIICDEANLLHANAHHMATVCEPLATVLARVEATDGSSAALIRPALLST